MHFSYYRRPLLWGLAVFIILLLCFYHPSPVKNDISTFIGTKEPVWLEGQVVSFAVSKKDSRNVIIQVSRMGGQPAAGRVYARIKNVEPKWKDTLVLSGKIKKPYGVQMPGNFDWREYLAAKHVFAEISADGAEVLRPAGWFWRAVRGVRADILDAFETHFEPNLAGMAGGVLLGERGEIDPSLYAAFQDSGAIHLLVASGGNVGFVTLIVFALCAAIGFERKKTAALALVLAGIYTLIAGADAPLSRAYFMTVCATAGYVLGRNSGVFQGLVLSCFVILLFNPAAVFETGFVMSFLATLAIVLCVGYYKIPYQWPRWVQFFGAIFLATLSTQLILLPVFTNVFYKVSLTGMVSNMILVPLASCIMGLSFLFYLFTLLKIGFLLKGILWGTLWLFEWLVEFFAGFSFSSLQAAAWPAGFVAAYYAVLILAFHAPNKMFVRRAGWACVAVAGVCLVGQVIFSHAPKAYLFGEWDKRAILLRVPGKGTFLAGTEIAADKLTRAVLSAGTRRLDGVLLWTDSPKEKENAEELKSLLRLEGVIVPFQEKAWPGDEQTLGRCRVQTLWGQHMAKDGRRWATRGYGGAGKDRVSYRIVCGAKEWLLGAQGRFIEQAGSITQAELNSTVLTRF